MFGILGNKYVLAAVGLFMGLSAALGWHYIDKAAAVRSAQQELADKVTIEAQRAQLDELKRRTAIAESARTALEVKVAVAENDAKQAEQELEAYAQSTDVNANGLVDDAVVGRLRNN